MPQLNRAVLCAFAFMGLAGVAHAEPVVVTFENYTTSGAHAVVTSGGFVFTAASESIATAANGSNCAPTCAANGTSALAVGSPGLNPPSVSPVTMVQASGLNFLLTGLDFAELSESAATNYSASTLVMTGLLAAGGTVTQTLFIDGINDGPGGGVDFQTALLDAVWGTSLLSSLQFQGFIGDVGSKAFQLDNIAVDVENRVPEPGTLALSMLALMGSACLRRGKTAA